ncbi:hypothetical protein ACU8KH_06128 [Lachancea thermotolerans]
MSNLTLPVLSRSEVVVINSFSSSHQPARAAHRLKFFLSDEMSYFFFLGRSREIHMT